MPQRGVRYSLGAVFSILLFLGLAGCSRGQQQPALPPQFLFVTMPATRTIEVFPANASGTTQPLGTVVEQQPDLPVDLSVDFNGEIFVANANGNVKVYGGRDFQYQLIRTVGGPHTGMAHLAGIAVDLSGSFYVSGSGPTPGQGQVTWFVAGLNGNVAPGRTISGPHTGLTNPGGIARDASGRVFVVERSSNKVLVFDADAKDDAAPAITLGPFHSPQHVFVDQLLNIYVSSKGDDRITVLVPTGTETWSVNSAFTSSAMRDPEGVGSDAAGRIAVAVPDGILFFGPNSNGASDPVTRLSASGLTKPTGLFIH